jgi:hypothetical protein
MLKRKEEQQHEMKVKQTKKKENKKMDERSSYEIKNNIAFLLYLRTYILQGSVTLLNIDFFLMATVVKG